MSHNLPLEIKMLEAFKGHQESGALRVRLGPDLVAAEAGIGGQQRPHACPLVSKENRNCHQLSCFYKLFKGTFLLLFLKIKYFSPLSPWPGRFLCAGRASGPPPLSPLQRGAGLGAPETFPQQNHSGVHAASSLLTAATQAAAVCNALSKHGADFSRSGCGRAYTTHWQGTSLRASMGLGGQNPPQHPRHWAAPQNRDVLCGSPTLDLVYRHFPVLTPRDLEDGSPRHHGVTGGEAQIGDKV